MNIKNIVNNLKIYCCYHNEELYDEYNLYESNVIKPINIIDPNIVDNWIIKYNGSLSEYCLALYIYRHQIKSNYIGFCHYRRHWNYIDFDLLNKCGIYTYSSNYNQGSFKNDSIVTQNGFLRLEKENDKYIFNFLLQNLEDYVKLNYNEYYDNYLSYLYGNRTCSYREMYIASWDMFNKIMGFIDGYMKFMWGEQYQNMFDFKNNNISTNELYIRWFALYIEEMVSLSIYLFNKDNLLENNYQKHSIDVYLRYTGNEDIENWVKKQYSLGIKDIVIFNESNSNLELDLYSFQNVLIVNDSIANLNLNEHDINEYFVNKNIQYVCPNYIIIFENNEYMNKSDIIKFKNEFWTNQSISNNQIIDIQYVNNENNINSISAR